MLVGDLELDYLVIVAEYVVDLFLVGGDAEDVGDLLDVIRVTSVDLLMVFFAYKTVDFLQDSVEGEYRQLFDNLGA